MLRFYRYLIYRLYTWRLQKNDDTPGATVIFIMSFIHLVHIMILYVLAIKLGLVRNLIHLNKPAKYLVVPGIALVYYLLVYNKKRWLKYVEEFKDETPLQRKRGTLFMQLFTIGSILLFFLLLPVLFWNYKK